MGKRNVHVLLGKGKECGRGLVFLLRVCLWFREGGNKLGSTFPAVIKVALGGCCFLVPGW